MGTYDKGALVIEDITQVKWPNGTVDIPLDFPVDFLQLQTPDYSNIIACLFLTCN